MKQNIKRGVGYCTEEDCEELNKGVFLLNHQGPYFCQRCRNLGYVVQESAERRGTGLAFKEVRVEFDYDPVRMEYRGLAIVKDTSLEGEHNSYVLRSPLVRTDRRALSVAEALLGNLNRASGAKSESVTSSEYVVSWDSDKSEYQSALKGLSDEWEKGGLGVRVS